MSSTERSLTGNNPTLPLSAESGNIAYIYGTFGDSRHPLYVSSPYGINGRWNTAKPSMIGVRQLHPPGAGAVTITQSLSAEQANDIRNKLQMAIAGSDRKGNRSYDYLDTDPAWRINWHTADGDQLIHSRTYTTIEDVMTDSENGSNGSPPTSDCLATEEGRRDLHNQLRAAVNAAGFGTREAVVAAAKYLSIAFPYDINYVSGNGGVYHLGVTAVPNTSLYMLNYKDGLNIDSETTSWGSLDDALFQTTQNKVENPAKLHGINCSSYVSWAIFNGGFDLYNDIDNMIAYYNDKQYDFSRSDRDKLIIKMNASYLGHGIGGSTLNDRNSYVLTPDAASSHYPAWKDAGQFFANGIQPGDLVVRGTRHIGIVIEVSDEYIYTADTFEHQNDYALCYNGYDEVRDGPACKPRAILKNPNLLHSGIYIRKFAADHAQTYWDKVISMDYVYNASTYKRTSSSYYGVSE
jgi:hypothetical protein